MIAHIERVFRRGRRNQSPSSGSGARRTAVVDFEVYVLMTMKLRLKMSQKLAELEAKLADHGLTPSDGERIHARVTKALDDEATFFDNLAKFVGIQHDRSSLRFDSELWPDFAFTATVGDDQRIESAGYRRVSGHAPYVESPIGRQVWSLDVDEFTTRFGPMTPGSQLSIFDESLPNYREYEFEWDGWPWGAGFSWGLFMFAAEDWE